MAYFTITTHERNRQVQAASLRTSARTLNSLFEPQQPLGPTRAELLRAERSSFLENAKDRWNSEIERAVRSLQNTNWEDIKQRRDSAIAKVLGDGLEGTRHGIENAERKIGETASVLGEKTERALEDGKDKAAAKAAQIKQQASAKASPVKDQAVAKASTVKDQVTAKASNIKAEAPAKVDQLRTEASRASAGTVDAARGAVRDAVSKGIEKGKELVGKAQDAIGAAASKVPSKEELKEAAMKSDVEKALEERYKPLTTQGLDRTPEEILADRYKSMA